MKVLDILWFTNRFGCIGIAQVEDDYDGIKYYMSQVQGWDVDIDTKRVMEWGATFPKEAGDVLFGVMK